MEEKQEEHTEPPKPIQLKWQVDKSILSIGLFNIFVRNKKNERRTRIHKF